MTALYDLFLLLWPDMLVRPRRRNIPKRTGCPKTLVSLFLLLFTSFRLSLSDPLPAQMLLLSTLVTHEPHMSVHHIISAMYRN